MNKYIVGTYIRGKTMKVETTLIVEAKDKDESIEKAKKILADEGFQYGGLDYCDLG